jgi:type IV secretory pathway VirD2 relaxase
LISKGGESLIIKGRFMRGNREKSAKHLNAHLRYVEHRSRDDQQETREDRHLFSNESDLVDREEAVNDVMDHTSTSVNYHKLILSPSLEEPVDDYRQWTRAVMHDLEEHQGKDLHWYGVYHNNTEHPHVHVVIAGAGENYETGADEPIKLYKGDYEYLRESAREHSEYDFYHQLAEDLQQLSVNDPLVHEMDPSWQHDPSQDMSFE